jgi:hypothetical protein
MEDDMKDARAGEGTGRVDELPAHEDDSDVAAQGGGGILSEATSAVVRGTGDRSGNAQGLDDEATGRDPDGVANDHAESDPTVDATPGLHDFTETIRDADPGRH